MEANQDLFRLNHIIDCIDKIISLAEILYTLENFENKWIEQDAMIRNFEIIGEASNYVSDETKKNYPINRVERNERNAKLHYSRIFWS